MPPTAIAFADEEKHREAAVLRDELYLEAKRGDLKTEPRRQQAVGDAVEANVVPDENFRKSINKERRREPLCAAVTTADMAQLTGKLQTRGTVTDLQGQLRENRFIQNDAKEMEYVKHLNRLAILENKDFRLDMPGN